MAKQKKPPTAKRVVTKSGNVAGDVVEGVARIAGEAIYGYSKLAAGIAGLGVEVVRSVLSPTYYNKKYAAKPASQPNRSVHRPGGSIGDGTHRRSPYSKSTGWSNQSPLGFWARQYPGGPAVHVDPLAPARRSGHEETTEEQAVRHSKTPVVAPPGWDFRSVYPGGDPTGRTSYRKSNIKFEKFESLGGSTGKLPFYLDPKIANNPAVTNGKKKKAKTKIKLKKK